MKDLNWINRGKWLELGPEKRALLTEQLRRDSELQAAQIRRERQSKRAKAQQEAEQALTRRQSMKAPVHTEDERVLVGNLIGEDHVNYVLMYNMLTGIRIAVSR